jgi:endonuclease YncB( thermonuclease family)
MVFSPMTMLNCTRFLILATTLLLCQISVAEILHGRVIGISDGDTVTVLDDTNTQYKVRLLGIDAPEKNQAFGNASKKNLSDLIFNRRVSVEYRKQDKYGRILGKIMLNGLDVNLEQVKSGLSWHYKKYQMEQFDDDRLLYVQTEEQARARKHGLWMDNDPIPPWIWRKARFFNY